MSAYMLLAISIISEVFGSSMLKASNGFKKISPILGVIAGYGLSFYCLAITLNTLPLGMIYAFWFGMVTALTALFGIFLYKELIIVNIIFVLCYSISEVFFFII